LVFLPLSVSSFPGIHSLGFHPSIARTRQLSTPKTPKRLFGKLLLNNSLVPPSCFLSISTAYSSCQPQVYCTLMSIMGSAAFPNSCTVASDVYLIFSRNAVHTPRRIPFISSRTTSLWPLPSCCYFAPYTQHATEVAHWHHKQLLSRKSPANESFRYLHLGSIRRRSRVHTGNRCISVVLTACVPRSPLTQRFTTHPKVRKLNPPEDENSLCNIMRLRKLTGTYRSMILGLFPGGCKAV
jgi:hypothetical protein